MPRGRAWRQEEIRGLLSLVQDSGEVAVLMSSTSRPNEALWQEISRGMAAAGYERSVAQCRSKWKALKQAFHSERETRRRAGHHSPLVATYYRAMKSIWKTAGEPAFGDRRMRGLVRVPSGKPRSALATHSSSSPEPPEHSDGEGTSALLLSPLVQGATDEPESSGCGDHVTGLPPTMPHTSCGFPRVSSLGGCADQKQEGIERNLAIVAHLPGDTSLRMERGKQMLPVTGAAPGFHRTVAMSKQPAEEPSVAGLFQNIQRLLEQILQTSQQQQVLLEGLASDTVSRLNILSHSLVQVGETLHELLTRPQTHPSILGHCGLHMPLPEGGHISSDVKKDDTLLYPAGSYTPP